jgi:endonuclease V-like protein UPF0215 family
MSVAMERQRCLEAVAVGRRAAEDAINDAEILGTTPEQVREFRAIAEALRLAEERIWSGWRPL